MKIICEAQFTSNLLIVTTKDRTVYKAPLSWFPSLWRMSPEERQKCEIQFHCLHWDAIDFDIGTEGLGEESYTMEGHISFPKEVHDEDVSLAEAADKNGEIIPIKVVSPEEVLRLEKWFRMHTRNIFRELRNMSNVSASH